MFEIVVQIFVGALTAYAGLGVVFAGIFVTLGIQRVDAEAQGAGIAFRLLVLPGVAAFWPVFALRWMRGTAEPPLERNPHR